MSGSGRPGLSLGEHGSITVKKKDGAWVASAYWRHPKTGVRSRPSASGPDAKEAEKALLAKLKVRAEGATGKAGSKVTPDSTIAELITAWRPELKRKQLATQTKARYWQSAKRIAEHIGRIRLREMDGSEIITYLEETMDESPSEARNSKTVIRALVQFAQKNRAITANVMPDFRVSNPTPFVPRALTLDGLSTLFALIEADRDRPRPGPKTTVSHDNLIDILRLQFAGGGLRISEPAALTRNDLLVKDEIDPYTGQTQKVYRLRFHQAVVYKSKDEETGEPGAYLIQEHNKTHEKKAPRIPYWAVEVVERRIAASGPSSGLLFHSDDKPLNLNNVRRTLREALDGTVLDWVTPHTIRRTVATMLANDEEYGPGVAQVMLGHTSERTTRLYVEHDEENMPDITSLTGRLTA